MPTPQSSPEPEWDADDIVYADASDEEIAAAIENVEGGMERAAMVLSAEMPILSQRDVDKMVEVAAQNSAATVDLGTPEVNEPAGRTRARNRLLIEGANFRRDIIRQFMGEGIQDPIKIFAEFFRNPELRSRWIDTLQDPWRVFKFDFKAIKAQQEKETIERKTLSERKDIRVDRLNRQYRAFMSIANDPKAPAAVKLKALEGASKMEREISVMERTINPTPGRGDLPSGGITPLGDDDDDEGGGGDYELPDVV